MTDESLEYRGHVKQFALHGHICDTCGTDFATAEDLRANKRIKVAFDKEVDGLLTGAQVKAIREDVGLTQAQAAALFGGGPVAFSKYENDEVVQSVAMDRLLRVAAEVPAAVPVLAKISGDPSVAGLAKVPELELMEACMPSPTVYDVNVGAKFGEMAAQEPPMVVGFPRVHVAQDVLPAYRVGENFFLRRHCKTPADSDLPGSDIHRLGAGRSTLRVTIHGASVEDFQKHEELFEIEEVDWPASDQTNETQWEFFPVAAPLVAH